MANAFHARHQPTNKHGLLLDTVFESSHVLLAVLDRDMNFLRVNNAYAAADGKPPAEFISKNHFALYLNAENEMLFRRVLETGVPLSVKAKPFKYVHKR